MSADDIDLSKLSLEEKLSHKVWKVRVAGYEEAATLFAQEDEGSAVFDQYASQIPAFVKDSNAAAQAQGVQAAFAFVDNSGPKPCARIAEDVAAAMVNKCVAAMKSATKDKALELALMLAEQEQGNVVMAELIKGFGARQPKIVAGCVYFATQLVQAFGVKAVDPKPLLKALPKVFDHVNKDAREQAKNAANELHRWLGDAIKSSLSGIKDVQLKELEAAWDEQETGKPKPTRLTKSQQAQAARKAASSPSGANKDSSAPGSANAEEGGVDEDEDEGPDAYELAEPVNGLAKIPKSFDSDIGEAKWSIRRDALQASLKALDQTKLADGDYGDHLRTMARLIGNDSNVIVVALAANNVEKVACGLRDRFSHYSPLVLEPLVDKLKEKKLNVVKAVSAALDIVVQYSPFDKVLEAIMAGLKQKNPEVKSQTALLLSRFVLKTNSKNLTKSVTKALASELVEKVNDSVPSVRDAAASALAALLKVQGEKIMSPYMSQLDNIKQKKVQAACDALSGEAKPSKASGAESSTTKAASAAKSTKPTAKSTASSASAKKSEAGATRKSSGPAVKKATKSSSSSVGSKAAGARKSSAARTSASSTQNTPLSASIDEPSQHAADDGSAEETAAKLFSAEVIGQLGEAAWKERLAGAEAVKAQLETMNDLDAATCLSLFKFFAMKTKNWKETNFQVYGAFVRAAQAVAEHAEQFPERCAHDLIPAIVNKLGDVKLGGTVNDCLDSLCVAVGCNFVCLRVTHEASKHRSPKVQAEACKYLSHVMDAFGMKIAPKPIVSYSRKCLAATNPTVRAEAIELIGHLRIHVGKAVTKLFDDEKPALLTQINEKFDQVASHAPPQPTLFERGSEPNDDADGDADPDDESTEMAAETAKTSKKAKRQAELDLDDSPKVKVAAQVTPEMTELFASTKWKERAEALDSLGQVIEKAKRIDVNLGDVPELLRQRLKESNKNMVITALGVLSNLAQKMGSDGSRHLSFFLPEILSNLGDAKDHVRQACVSALDAWVDNVVDLDDIIKAECVAAAVGGGKPNEQTELLNWLAKRLDDPEETASQSLKVLVKPVFAALENRNNGVRKAAQAVLPHLVARVGLDKVKRACNNLPASSKANVLSFIEKAAQSSTAPTAATKTASSKSAPSKPSKTAASSAASASTGSSQQTSSSSKAAGGLKRRNTAKRKTSAQDDAGESSDALLKLDQGKAQRQADEKRMRILKWNFSQPREEFVSQLHDQLKGCTTAALHEQLTSSDFKQHAKALDKLAALVGPESSDDSQRQAALSCMDLLLKWVTLRFFDTNTTVILKSLQFVSALFASASSDSYEMSDYEAGSFLPYLLIKAGDKMEPVRAQVRGLLRSITHIYPAGKLFAYVIEGLKSKNARQRAECLGVLSNLLDRHGMAVCSVGPARACSAIAQLVSDRDSGVRSAALDGLVSAYNYVGEDIYRLIGPLNDKDTSLIQERIKRCGKHNKADAPSASSETSKAVAPDAAKDDARGTAVKGRKKSAPTSDIHQEFSLDLAAIESQSTAALGMPQLAPTSLDDEDAGAERKASAEALQPLGSRSSASKFDELPAVDSEGISDNTSSLQRVLSQVSSTDIGTAVAALKIVEDMARDGDKALVPHVDTLLTACVMQLRFVFSLHMSEEKQAQGIRLCKHILSCYMKVFSQPDLARAPSQSVVHEVLSDLIKLLLDEKMEAIKDGPQVLKALNVILLKALDNGDKNVLFGALLSLLKNCISEAVLTAPKFGELVMKCLWKLTKKFVDFKDEIDAGHLLVHIHQFLTAHPPSAWQSKDDTPLKTVKTLIHTMTSNLGVDILQHVPALGDAAEESKVVSYVLLTLIKAGHDKTALQHEVDVQMARWRQQGETSRLKRVEAAGNGTTESDLTSRRRGTVTRHKSVREFERVEREVTEASTLPTTTDVDGGQAGTASEMQRLITMAKSKEHTREGVAQLKAFLKAHPEVDIEQHMSGLSDFMKNYLRRRLAEDASVAPASTGIPRPSAGQTGRVSATSASVSGLPRPSSSVSSIPTRARASVAATVSEGGSSQASAMHYLEQLKALKARTAGTSTTGDAPTSPDRNETRGPSAVSINISPSRVRSPEKDLPNVVSEVVPRSPLAPKDNRSGVPASPDDGRSLQSIKARLAKLKRHTNS